MNRANPDGADPHAWQANLLRPHRQTRAPIAGLGVGRRHPQRRHNRVVYGDPCGRASAGGQKLRPAALRPYLDPLRLGADLLAGAWDCRQQRRRSRIAEDRLQARVRLAREGAWSAHAPSASRGRGSPSDSGAAQRVERSILEHRLLRQLGRQQLPGAQACASPSRLGDPELAQPRRVRPRAEG